MKLFDRIFEAYLFATLPEAVSERKHHPKKHKVYSSIPIPKPRLIKSNRRAKKQLEEQLHKVVFVGERYE